jgi:hypothetical protein
MPRGLIKATNYYQNLEAVNDWLTICRDAASRGYGDLAVKFAPPEGAGWRKIDKRIAKLREAMNVADATIDLDKRQTCLRACPLLGEYPEAMLARRREVFVAQIEAAKEAHLDQIASALPTSAAELLTDGSDTSLAHQLDEAGFGSGGVM